MCGRYSMAVSREKLKQQFPELRLPASLLKKSYNIAPTHSAYVRNDQSPNQLQEMVWGLIPYWSKDGKNSGRLINARSEGIATKPSFRIPIRRRRCLVFADSFYEWKKVGTEKLPYRILMRDEAVMVFAGIWDVWKNGNTVLQSFSIITTVPNKDMTLIHNRMPLIFKDKTLQQQWLDSTASLEAVIALMQPLEDGWLSIYPVSTQVNKVSNNSPNLHERFNANPTLF